jgi:2-polyprenyl-3-methyl-5-hydroxy-6-metoxy-1,4-benzoquinol methylase
MIQYTKCPVCENHQLSPHLLVTDFSVTKEVFQLMKCNQCALVFTQNIPDATSIGKYYQFEDYISHTDTQKGFINKAYHFVRKRTLLTKLKWVKKHTQLQKGTILDIGCGTGAFLNTMQQVNWSIVGLEPDETARKNATTLYNINPQLSSELFNLPAASFDAITMWHVLEHVHELQAYVKQLQLLLKPNGALFIAVPNYTSYDAQQYKAYWAAYDVPRHLYHFAPTAIKQLFEQHGFEIIAYQPMWYDSFYVSMLSEQYKNGSKIKALFVALLSNCKTLFNAKKCSSITYIIKHKTT